MPSVSEVISKDLTIPVELVDVALRQAHYRYKKIRVPKRSGDGYRTIIQPTAELKLLHQWLIGNVLGLLPVSQIATAFRSGASILLNANIHRNSLYSVRLDVRDFFPSIHSNDLLTVITKNKTVVHECCFFPEFPEFIKKVCFDSDDKLPIGYPSSPAIANAVMFGMDNVLLQLISGDAEKYGRARLTRYADDFVFSTDKAGACQRFVEAVTAVFNETESPSLTVNRQKTRFMSRAGGSTLITGLRVNQAGGVRVHPNYRDHVRLLLKLYVKGRLTPEQKQKLVGHLAYVEHVDPQLFTRLSYRYFSEISALRSQ